MELILIIARAEYTNISNIIVLIFQKGGMCTSARYYEWTYKNFLGKKDLFGSLSPQRTDFIPALVLSPQHAWYVIGLLSRLWAP